MYWKYFMFKYIFEALGIYHLDDIFVTILFSKKLQYHIKLQVIASFINI